MRWHPWARIGFAILAPVLVGALLAASEWAREPTASLPSVAAPAPHSVKPQTSPAPAHVREVQQALVNAGYDPGPIDGIFGARTKSALQKYITVPPPQVPRPADLVIAQFRAIEPRQGP